MSERVGGGVDVARGVVGRAGKTGLAAQFPECPLCLAPLQGEAEGSPVFPHLAAASGRAPSASARRALRPALQLLPAREPQTLVCHAGSTPSPLFPAVVTAARAYARIPAAAQLRHSCTWHSMHAIIGWPLARVPAGKVVCCCRKKGHGLWGPYPKARATGACL